MDTFTLTFEKEIHEFTDTIRSFTHASYLLYKNQLFGSTSDVAEF